MKDQGDTEPGMIMETERRSRGSESVFKEDHGDGTMEDHGGGTMEDHGEDTGEDHGAELGRIMERN